MSLDFKNISLQRCCFTGMHKAFSRCAPLGGLVLWLSPFYMAQYGSANITIRCADSLDPFLFALVLHKVAGAIKEYNYSKLGILTMPS